MQDVFILLPNQLFQSLPESKAVLLVEHPRFFSEFRFHKKKLLFHRAGMQYYRHFLKRQNRRVYYLEHNDLRKKDGLTKWLKDNKVESVDLYDPVDHVLKKSLQKEFKAAGAVAVFHESPLFLCEQKYLERFFSAKRHYSMNSFYIAQRKRLGILLNKQGKPEGGKWSLDVKNRRRLPEDVEVPEIWRPAENSFTNEAASYVNRWFADHPGKTENFFYPVTHADAEKWLHDFIENRLELFGPYEDAIVKDKNFLFHSVLSCLLNTGLLTARQVLDAALEHGQKQRVQINSLEGFVRQIIGWREFMRAVYVLEGSRLSSANFWKFKRGLANTFYGGSTGIEPVDAVISKVMENAYTHHIERLMILGNFMLLCEIHPSEVYRWFMEMFIDSYDWVMLTNVFGMSQYAAGGVMTTKPYISSSNYIRKMSDFKNGPWCEIWDGLFWRFIHRHNKVFEGIGRTKTLAAQAERMKADKMKSHINKADSFLKTLFKAETPKQSGV